MSRRDRHWTTRVLAAVLCMCMVAAVCGAAGPEEGPAEPAATPEAAPVPETTAEPEITDEPEVTTEPEAIAEPAATAEPEARPALADLLEIQWGAPDFVYAEGWMAEDDRVATIAYTGEEALDLRIVFVSKLSGMSGTALRDVTLADGTMEAVPLADGILTLLPGEMVTVRLALTGDPAPEELGGSIGSVRLEAVSAED